MHFPRRFDVVLPWLRARGRGERTDVSTGGLMRYLLQPTAQARASKYIRSIEPAGEYLRVWFHGLEDPLYWPADFEIKSLYEFTDEQFDPAQWHQYEVGATRVEAGDTVLDCGASEGLFSLRMARRCGRVVACEPVPGFLRALERSFAALPNVEILPVALGAECRQLAFQARPNGSSALSEEGNVTVEQTTLDTLFADTGRRLDFLKADIEGAEIHMLAGARRTLSEYRPKIAITTYHGPDEVKNIDAFLRDLDVGYRTFTKGINSWGTAVMLHAWVPRPGETAHHPSVS